MSEERESRCFEFGPFVLDPEERVLLRDGRPVQLAPKAFDTLHALVREGGRLVGKDALMATVWPGTYVEENNLTHYISLLRKTLGQAADGRPYIETVARRGYRFAAGVSDAGGLLVARRTRSRIVIRESEDEAGDTGGELERGRAGEAASRRSLAVLPFRQLGARDEDDDLGLAMADALITRLGNIRQVVVRPTGAVRRYVDATPEPADAARELNVESVLDGNIQRSGGRIRVTVQLVSADGATLWAQKFDGALTDIFSVQDSISEEVARSLTLRLSADDVRRSRKWHTANLDAYVAYTKGRYFWDQRSKYGFGKAVEFFHRAVELDPKYALAYAGLADTYIIQALYDLLPPQEAFPAAKEAAARALRLDPSLGEAHTSAAATELFYDWDFAAAEEGFTRAIDLNPNHVIARLGYADLLSASGRHDEGIREMRRALSLDPLNLGLMMNVGDHYWFAGRFEEAARQCREVIELAPHFVRAYLRLALSLMKLGDYGQADAALEEAKKRSEGGEEPLAWFAQVYAASNRKEDAARALGQLRWRARQTYVPAYLFAAAHAALGEADEALAWLGRAREERSTWAIFIGVDPIFEKLRHDYGFLAVTRRLKGYPPA